MSDNYSIEKSLKKYLIIKRDESNVLKNKLLSEEEMQEQFADLMNGDLVLEVQKIYKFHTEPIISKIKLEEVEL